MRGPEKGVTLGKEYLTRGPNEGARCRRIHEYMEGDLCPFWIIS